MGNCCVAASSAQGYSTASRAASGLSQSASPEVKDPAACELPVAQKQTRLPTPHFHTCGPAEDTIVLDHCELQQLYADHLQPVAALCIAHVDPITLSGRAALESDSSSGTRPSPTSSIPPTFVTARLVHTEHSVGRGTVGNHAGLDLVISSENGSVTLRCILANTSALQALALSSEQDILRVLDNSFKRDAGFLAIFHDIIMRLLSGQLASVTHFVPGHFGAGRRFLNMRMSPFVFRAEPQVPVNPTQNSSPRAAQAAHIAAAGANMTPHENSGDGTRCGPSDPRSGRDDGDVCNDRVGVVKRGGVTPAMILELDVPYEGKELAARLQRDYMIISNIPSIVTMFDTSGRVLHQNLPSISFMGQRVAPPRDTSALPAATTCNFSARDPINAPLHNTRTEPPQADAASEAGLSHPASPPNEQAPPNQHDHRNATLWHPAATAARSWGAAEPAEVGSVKPGDGKRDRNVTWECGAGGSDEHGAGEAAYNVFRALFALEPEKGEQAWRAACAGKEWQGVVMMPPSLALDPHYHPVMPPAAAKASAAHWTAVNPSSTSPPNPTKPTLDAITIATTTDVPRELLPPLERTQPQATDKVRQRHPVTRAVTGASTASSSGCGSQALEAASRAAWPVQQRAMPPTAAAVLDPRVGEVARLDSCGGEEAGIGGSKPSRVAAQLAAGTGLLRTGSSCMVEVPDPFDTITDSDPQLHSNTGPTTGSRSVLDTTFSLEVIPPEHPRHNQQHQHQLPPSLHRQQQTQGNVNPLVATLAQQEPRRQQQERQQEEERQLQTLDSAQLNAIGEDEPPPPPSPAAPVSQSAPSKQQQQGGSQQVPLAQLRPHTRPSLHPACRELLYASYFSNSSSEPGRPYGTAALLGSSLRSLSFDGTPGGGGSCGGAPSGESAGNNNNGSSTSCGAVSENNMAPEEEHQGYRQVAVAAPPDTNADDVNASVDPEVIAGARDSQSPPAAGPLPEEVAVGGDNEGDNQDVVGEAAGGASEINGTGCVRNPTSASSENIELSFVLERLPYGALPTGGRTSKAASSTAGRYIRFSGAGMGGDAEPVFLRFAEPGPAVRQPPAPIWDAVATAASAPYTGVPASDAGRASLKHQASVSKLPKQHIGNIADINRVQEEEVEEDMIGLRGDVAVAASEAAPAPFSSPSRAPQNKKVLGVKSDSTAQHIDCTATISMKNNTPEIVAVGVGDCDGGNSGGGNQPGNCSRSGLLVFPPPKLQTPLPPPPLTLPSTSTSTFPPRSPPSAAAPSPTHLTTASSTTAAPFVTASVNGHAPQQPTKWQYTGTPRDRMSVRGQLSPRSEPSMLLLSPPHLSPRAAGTHTSSSSTTTTIANTRHDRTGPMQRPIPSSHLPTSASRRALIKHFRRLSGSSALMSSSASPSPSPPSAAAHLLSSRTTTPPGPRAASTSASPLGCLTVPIIPTSATTPASSHRVNVTPTPPPTLSASSDSVSGCPAALTALRAATQPSSCRPLSAKLRPRPALMRVLTSALGGWSGEVPRVIAAAAAAVSVPGRGASMSRLSVPTEIPSAATRVASAAAVCGGGAANIEKMGTQEVVEGGSAARSGHGIGLYGGSRRLGSGALSRAGDVDVMADSGRSPTGQSRTAPGGDNSAGGLGGGGRGTEGSVRWHEVVVRQCCDPVSGQPVVLVVQTDVTCQVVAEAALLDALEAEYRLLSEVLPQHVVQHMMLQLNAEAEAERQQPRYEEQLQQLGTLAGGNGVGCGGGVGSRSGVSRSAFRHVLDPAALATLHDSVTVLFADIKGFTEMSKEVSPGTVMTFLNDLYTRFDSLTDVYGVYKVETIGDCYMVAGGLVARDGEGYGRAVRGAGDTDPLHAMRVLAFARAMLEEAAKVVLPNTGEPVQLRIGMHSGSVMSGVVGQKMPRFCLFGDTINTASRMESTGQPGGVHISSETRALLPSEEDEEGWLPTGGVDVKGKGRMNTFFWWPHSERAIRQRSSAEQRASLLATLSHRRLPSSSPPPRPQPLSLNTPFTILPGAQTQVHSATATVGFPQAVGGPYCQRGSFARASYS